MQNFDFNEALKAIQSGKPITGSDGVLAPLIKQEGVQNSVSG